MKSKKLFYGILLVCVLIVVGISLFIYLDKLKIPSPTIPVPPTEAVETKLSYSVGGCWEKEEREYTKTRGLEEKVDVRIDNGFIKLTHHLSYVCCAKMKVYLDSLETYPDYTLIKIKEKNEGEMCRCICDYKIDMKVGALEKGKYRVQIFGIEFENMPAEHLWEKEIEITGYEVIPSRPKEDFCGWSTYGQCLTDLDCIKGGCSGQVCQSKQEEPIITTCEWRDCYNAKVYGLECKCVNRQCQWYKYPKE